MNMRNKSGIINSRRYLTMHSMATLPSSRLMRLEHSRTFHTALKVIENYINKKVFKHDNENNNMNSNSNHLSDVNRKYQIFKLDMKNDRIPKILLKSLSTPIMYKSKCNISYYHYYEKYLYKEKIALFKKGIIPRFFYSLLSNSQKSLYFQNSVLAPTNVNPCQFIGPKYNKMKMLFRTKYSQNMFYLYQNETLLNYYNRYYFMLNEIIIPLSFDKLISLKNQLGLLSRHVNNTPQEMSIHSFTGVGLRGILYNSLLDKPLFKCLVDINVFCNGVYGHIIVLVFVGIGCTVWYTSGSSPTTNVNDMYLLLYKDYTNCNITIEGYKKIGFILDKEVVSIVNSAFASIYPFNEMIIDNVNSCHKTYICLALIVGFFISIGLYPNDINDVLLNDIIS